MRLIFTLAAASLAITTAACERSANDGAGEVANDTMATDMNAAMPEDMNMTGAMGAVLPANDFVAAVAASDMYEIESGKLAQKMATMEECRKFGDMLVTDHTKSSAMLKTAAAAATPAVMLPTMMPAEMQAKLDALKAAKGAEFDKLFIEQQKQGHQMTLDTLNAYAASGDVPSLKEFAAKSAPVVKSHLDMLNKMKV